MLIVRHYICSIAHYFELAGAKEPNMQLFSRTMLTIHLNVLHPTFALM